MPALRILIQHFKLSTADLACVLSINNDPSIFEFFPVCFFICQYHIVVFVKLNKCIASALALEISSS